MQIDVKVLITYAIISLVSLLIGFQLVFRKKPTDRFIGWLLVVVGVIFAAIIGMGLYFSTL